MANLLLTVQTPQGRAENAALADQLLENQTASSAFHGITQLATLALVMPLTNAESERGNSTLKRIKTKDRCIRNVWYCNS